MAGLIKPRRRFSRATVIWTLVPSWLAIAWALWQGVAMAQIVLPSMVMLIASVIGVYQGVGHLDLRGQLNAAGLPRQRDPPEWPREPDDEGRDRRERFP